MANFKPMITVELVNAGGSVIDSQDFNLMESARVYIREGICMDEDCLSVGDNIRISEREVEVE